MYSVVPVMESCPKGYQENHGLTMRTILTRVLVSLEILHVAFARFAFDRFNADRVTSGIAKLKSARKNVSQKRMDRYFLSFVLLQCVVYGSA